MGPLLFCGNPLASAEEIDQQILRLHPLVYQPLDGPLFHLAQNAPLAVSSFNW